MPHGKGLLQIKNPDLQVLPDELLNYRDEMIRFPGAGRAYQKPGPYNYDLCLAVISAILFLFYFITGYRPGIL